MHVNEGRGEETGEGGWAVGWEEEEDSDSYNARYYTRGNACGTFAF